MSYLDTGVTLASSHCTTTLHWQVSPQSDYAVLGTTTLPTPCHAMPFYAVFDQSN